MATWTAFYVATQGTAAHALPRIASALHDLRDKVRGTLTVKPAPTAPWIEVECVGIEDLEALSGPLSARLHAHIVACAIQTTASVLQLRRFRNGEEKRCLEYADGEQLTNRGDAEPWEAELLFSDGELDRDPDPWKCLQRCLAIDGAAWDALRSAPSAAALRGAEGRWIDGIAKALAIVGTAAAAFSSARSLPVIGAAGFLVAWLGLVIHWRRASVVIAVGGGLIGAVVLLLVGAAVGALFH